MNTTITLDATYNGQGRDDTWLHDVWQVTLTRGTATMTIPYKMGVGHNRAEPTLADVLESLRSDALVDEHGDYDEVLADMPYSKARPLADAIRRQTNQLRTFFGDEYDAFLADS